MLDSSLTPRNSEPIKDWSLTSLKDKLGPEGAPPNKSSPSPSGNSSRPERPTSQKRKILGSASLTSASVGSRRRNTSKSVNGSTTNRVKASERA
jgi:hypothetical protein